MPRTFAHEDFGFEISVPDGWVAMRDSLGCAFVAIENEIEGFRASITVGIEAGGPHDLSELTDRQTDQLRRSLTDYDADPPRELPVAARPGLYVEARYREGIYDIVLRQWLVLTDERAIAVAATVPAHRRDELDATIRDCIDGFRLVAPGSSSP